MAYLVLARKYRPDSFSKLIGQEHIVRTLRNAMALNRVHHAFLFTGARGVGKTTAARLLARAVNCLEPVAGEPCQQCSACRETANSQTSDILEIDGASNTGVDNVRELREAVRYMPATLKFKVYIIDEVHMLSQAAFNALLKTLEEPPPHVKFIFATTEPHKIPVTILSRCQRFDFRRVAQPRLAAHLQDILQQEHVMMGAEALQQIARQADGSVRDALSLLDQVLSFVGDNPTDELVFEALGTIDRKTLVDLCDALLQRDATRVLNLVHTIEIRGHDLADAAMSLCEHLRDVAVCKYTSDNPDAQKPVSLQAGDLQSLQTQAEKRSHSDWQRLFAQAVRVAHDTQRSLCPKVTLEMGLLQLLEIEPASDLQDLIARIDTLLGQQQPAKTHAAPSSVPTQQSCAGISAVEVNIERSSIAPQTRPSDAAQSTQQAWHAFVQQVRAKRPALASVLEHGSVQAFGAQGVALVYPQQTFYWDAVSDTSNRALLLELLEIQFGTKVSLQIIPQDDAAHAHLLTLAAVEAQQTQSEQAQQDQRAREHQAVRDTVAILDGKIQDIRLLASDG